MKNLRMIIHASLSESLSVTAEAVKQNENAILKIARAISAVLARGRKVILFGNGGSAADSQHIAAEFVGRFQKERKSLAAVALTTNTSSLTAIANDYGFESVFARQLQGIGRRGDVAIGLSTSGNSQNVIEAFVEARRLGLRRFSFTGCGGGKLARVSDVSIIVPSRNTARIQEAHICIAHMICDLVERSIT